MRIPKAIAALGVLVALAACNGGPTAVAGSCVNTPVVQANGAVFTTRGPAAAAEAGAVVAVVARERGCDTPVITVSDSAAPRPRAPWVDGDAFLLGVGTRLYARVGSEPGTELVAERTPGEWVRLAVKGVD